MKSRVRRRVLVVVALAMSSSAAACGLRGGDGDPAMAHQSVPTQIRAGVDSGPGDRQPGQLPTLAVVEPADGATVTSPFVLRVSVDGFHTVASGATNDGEAHVHLLVNQPCLPTGTVIPADVKHIHWGDGSEYGVMELPSGTHELCVQLGDGFHAAVAVSQMITINVVD